MKRWNTRRKERRTTDDRKMPVAKLIEKKKSKRGVAFKAVLLNILVYSSKNYMPVDGINNQINFRLTNLGKKNLWMSVL